MEKIDLALDFVKGMNELYYMFDKVDDTDALARLDMTMFACVNQLDLPLAPTDEEILEELFS